jgi:hypothetical protein
LQADEERPVPFEGDQAASPVWVRTVARAIGIEGVYTGMENVMKEVLNVVDKGVFATSDSFHAQLLRKLPRRPPRETKSSTRSSITNSMSFYDSGIVNA